MDEERGHDDDPESRRSDDAGAVDSPAGAAVDPDVRPWPLRALSADDPDPPRIVAAVGQVGVYLGLAALVLAVAGVVAGFLNVLPIARVAIFFSLVLVSVAMGLGVVFQIYVIRRS